MPEIKLRCPHCKSGIQATVNGTEDVVQVKCRNCGGSVKFRPPANHASAAASGARSTSDDPLDFLSSPTSAPTPTYSQAKPSGRVNPYAGTMTRTTPQSNLFLWLGIGAAAIVGIGVATVGALWFVARATNVASAPGSTVNESASSNAGGATATQQKPAVSFPNVPRPESRASLVRELDSMREKADRSVASISEAEKQTIGADRLTEAEPQFREFFFRAAQATLEERSMSDVVQAEAKLAAEIQRMSPTGGNQPPRNYIWTLNSTNDPADRWGMAAYAISSAKFRSELALQSRFRYPDPLQEQSQAFDWSSEERRVLSAYWLQGELERNVATELLASLRDGQTIHQMQDRCFAAMEQCFGPAKELAKVKSTQGSMLINEPKGTPYAKHARATRRVLEELLETFPEPNIEWILQHTIRFSDAIEELQFGRTASVDAFTQRPVREQYDGIQAMIAKQKQEALAAEKKALEEKQQREEQAKQEETRRAALAAQQEKERQLAQAKQERETREQGETPTSGEAQPNSDQGLAGGPGRGLGPGVGRPPIGFGRGPGGPAANGQAANGQGGPGSNGPGGQPPAFGPPPGFGGQGGPPPGFGGQGGPPPGFGGQNGGRPPNVPPTFPTPEMGTTVAIRIKGPANMDVNAYLDKLKAALKTGNYQVAHSGQEATITLGYKGDIQTVIDAIDFGTVESSDAQKREVRVTVK